MSHRDHYAVLRHVLTGEAVEGISVENPGPDPTDGWAVEFGVATGTSLGIIAEHMPVIGFDSFEGLPEDWREGFLKGSFSRDGYMPQIPPNAMIVPGLFEETTAYFPYPILSLVHIDCDLYSSTVTALESVVSRIGPGTIIVFDEFHGYEGWVDHEAKAWREFVSKHKAIFRTVAVGEQARAFVISRLAR